jgi:hypothetical protein
MEMIRVRHLTIRRLRLSLLLLLFLAGIQLMVLGQRPTKTYTVKDGKMYIDLSRNLKSNALDSFIIQFNLADLGLQEALNNNSFVKLRQMGWDIIINNRQKLVISKGLEAVENYNNPADEIMVAEKHPTIPERFPSVSESLRFGVNQFRNKYPFATQDSSVTFFLKNHTRGRSVFLAGSFNYWDPRALAMTRTDSGWIAQVKLTPGKWWYKFIVDGNWQIDNDNSLREDDGSGNTNSVFFKPNMVIRLSGMASARRVFLSGSFNDWRKDELEMQKTTQGWELPIYLAHGTHTYRFIVDGRSMIDPKNPEKLPDGHGGFNSLIHLGVPHLFNLNGFASAAKVELTGSFNHWRPDELFMVKTNLAWKLSYTLGPGNYEYNFVVDGKIITDPDNPITTTDKTSKLHSFLIIAPNHTFVLKGYGNAKTVFLAGDFNDWNPGRFPMKKQGDQWVFSLHMSAGKHVYKFIVDGKWIRDPDNKLWDDNDNQNSIIWIEP